MRRLAGWFLGVSLLGCAASAPPPVTPEPAPIASAPVTSPPALREEPRNLGHLPASPAAHGSIDPARLSELVASLARRFQPHESALVEQVLGLASSSLAAGRLADEVGVDRTRSIQVSVAPIDPAGAQVVAAARSQAPTDRHWFQVEGISRSVQKAFSANRPSPIHIRVALPASDFLKRSLF